MFRNSVAENNEVMKESIVKFATTVFKRTFDLYDLLSSSTADGQHILSQDQLLSDNLLLPSNQEGWRRP